jgi:hypothetical protein
VRVLEKIRPPAGTAGCPAACLIKIYKVNSSQIDFNSVVNRSYEDMLKNAVVLTVLIFFLVLPLLIRSNYLLGILIVTGLYTIIVIGLGILMGYAGQVSFGQAAFFGLGGYTAAILSTSCSWPTPAALLAAMVLPGLVAALIGRPTLKLKELYLALATLAFGILVHILFNEGGEITGGPSGLMGIPYLSLGGLVFDRDIKFYYLVLAVVLLVSLAVHNLIQSRTGRALRAIRESEHAAEAAGMDTVLLKPQAPGKKSVTVSYMDHVMLRPPGHHQGPGHHLRPVFNILPGVTHHGGFAGRTRGGMDAHNIAHGCGKKSVGVIIPQVLLDGEGQLAEIRQGLDVSRLDPFILKGLPVKGHPFINPPHRLPEPLRLQVFQTLPGHGLNFPVPVGNPGIPTDIHKQTPLSLKIDL